MPGSSYCYRLLAFGCTYWTVNFMHMKYLDEISIKHLCTSFSTKNDSQKNSFFDSSPALGQTGHGHISSGQRRQRCFEDVGSNECMGPGPPKTDCDPNGSSWTGTDIGTPGPACREGIQLCCVRGCWGPKVHRTLTRWGSAVQGRLMRQPPLIPSHGWV